MAEEFAFGVEPLTCHAFNHDRSRLAISPNNNEVHIYRKDGNKWVQESILNQHDLRISSIDWAPKSNRIVSCSADRNAYVWCEVNGKWKPTLVLLRINRAATCVKWSPKEDKFAVGSGAKLISVCYFEEDNDWWVSKHIKKQIKSTITCLDWHPDNILVACGSTDYKVRIFSAFVKEVDGKEPPASVWGSKLSSGTCLIEYSAETGSWIHGVSFSPDGNQLAWVSHDSSVSVADSSRQLSHITMKTRFLPYLSVVWSSPQHIVAAGHDCYPMLFNYESSSGSLTYVDKIDKSEKKEADGFSAMKKFRDLDKRGIENHAGPGGDSLGTIHQNTIVEVRTTTSKNGPSTRNISTVGLDGKLVMWDLSSLHKSMSGLRIK